MYDPSWAGGSAHEDYLLGDGNEENHYTLDPHFLFDTSSTVIEARDLKKHFRSIKALNGVTVEIPEGVTLVLGPNGGGKSTFLKLATGVYRSTSGEILVFGERPWNNRRVEERFSVAYDPPAFPQFVTGREWLKFFAESRGVSEDSIIKAAELFDATSFLDKG